MDESRPLGRPHPMADDGHFDASDIARDTFVVTPERAAWLEQRRSRLHALVEESVASGPATPCTETDWAELRDIAAGCIG